MIIYTRKHPEQDWIYMLTWNKHYVILTLFMDDCFQVRARRISMNPDYIQWLSNQEHLQECFKAGVWFQSKEHTTPDKYLTELKSEMRKITTDQWHDSNF